METVRRGASFGAAPGAAVVPDVAVFSDPVYNIPNESVQILTRERFERWSLPRSGVAWDLYHLADIAHPDLPVYKAYVFVNAYAATREQREAIKRVCRRQESPFAACDGCRGRLRRRTACGRDGAFRDIEGGRDPRLAGAVGLHG